MPVCQRCNARKTYHTCADCGARLCGKCTERVEVYDEPSDTFVMARLCKGTLCFAHWSERGIIVPLGYAGQLLVLGLASSGV